jgi:hypothetical protein
VAGVRAGEIEEAFAAGDNDLLVALAMIVMARHGKVAPVDALWAAPAGAMAFAIGDRPEDAEEALLPPPKLPAAGANDSETKPPSGTTSSGGGALQESGPPAIGTRG